MKSPLKEKITVYTNDTPQECAGRKFSETKKGYTVEYFDEVHPRCKVCGNYTDKLCCEGQLRTVTVRELIDIIYSWDLDLIHAE